MSDGDLDLVHLVWAPLGPQALERFLASYRAHPAGVDHRLVLVFNGFRDSEHRAPWDELTGAFDHDRLDMLEPALDLACYRRAASESTARRLCFVNSYAAVLADGWLQALTGALDAPDGGMAAATGSWESTYSAAPVWLKPLRRRAFSPFPNPHLRTNAFALDRELLLDLEWPEVGTDKLAALELENGRRSLSHQVTVRGLATVVAGRDGHAYLPDQWPASATFRSGEQENLLVADNRTEQYAEADPQRRRELARFAWGDAAR